VKLPRRRFLRLAAEPAELAAHRKSEMAKWGMIIEVGIKAD
jgi:hypothetical protein